MKQAEQWVDENPHDVLWNEEVGREESITIVRAIQADALRHAAAIANMEVSVWEGFSAAGLQRDPD